MQAGVYSVLHVVRRNERGSAAIVGGASTRHAAIPQVGTPYSGSRPDYRFLRPWLAKGLAISKRGGELGSWATVGGTACWRW